MNYVITYWLTNQSKLFSDPQRVVIKLEEMETVIHTAIEHGYEIESIVRINEYIN